MIKTLGFPENTKFNQEKIIASGHSFGGITATRAAYLDKRVKLCLTFDPWYFIYDDDIMKGIMKLEQPFCMIVSENFGFEGKYDCFRSIGTLL